MTKSVTRIVGLAGATATGKSAIARHLVAAGAVHIDADTIGHWVLDEPAIRDRVVAAFGEDVLADRRIDRGRLGPIVFGDPASLERLNSIIHPRIIEVCVERVEACRERGVALVVIDAALLLEVDMPFTFDLIIALHANEDEQRRRLLAAGLPREQIDARLRNQRHLDAAFGRADVVVDANRPLTDVLVEIDRIIEEKL